MDKKQRLLIFALLLALGIAGIAAIALWRVQADQTRRLDTMYKEISSFNAQKDSLTRNLAEATNVISDVYAQVSMISGEVAVSNTLEKIDNRDYKVQIASKLQRISAMVDGYKAQMQNAEQQIAFLKQQNAAMAGQMKVLEETVARLKDITLKQQMRIEELIKELELTREEREKYKQQAIQTARALFETQERLNTGFYIAGTVEELKSKGIIEKRGSVLFLGGAWQPVSNLADSAHLTEQFKKINVERAGSIPIPFSSYKFLSPHNERLAKVVVGEKGVSPFALKISNPQKFWGQSKYLIIAEW
jgi:enamine deaminase RidA (YjgF/YER057c/UK114 family)